MNIYIKVELKQRELESRLLLAMVAAERGHEVLLGSTLLTLELVKKRFLKPGIIFEKSIVPSKRRINELKSYKDHNCKITSIDEEGGFINNSFKYLVEERFSPLSIRLTDKIFTWGNRDYRKLKSYFSKFKNKFSLTGNPRVDFWRKEFDNYYENQKLSQIKSSDEFLLLASNFGSMMHERRIWQEVKVLRDRNIFERGRDEFLFYDYKSYQIKHAARFVKAIRKISQKFKNLKIVVRPHPTESADAWKSIIGEHKNIFVIQEGSIGKWIRKAKLVLHNSCTSGVESHSSNIPTIAYRPCKSNFEMKFPNSLSINVFNEKKLIEKIEQILKNKIQIRRNKKLNDYFFNIKDELASDNIVKEWEKLDNGKLSKKNNLLKLKALANLKELKGKLVNKLLSNKSKKFIQDPSRYKFAKITNNELKTITDNLRKTLKRFENVNVEQFSDKLILINRKKNKN